ncbi:hypothetical protein AXJ14_gp078 [Geobacillus virus E3]|uniref:hypothetical protein n=1 Tax=Geobacillus virus E3 TaxID=1572712 RepID=UPI000671A6FE|nr:hypothetical protein AXJ14_gp078 [Geobacillus virus E3]AJA41398.1 hypothetical protein E3_079 [Geobacillus virus E3]
MEKEVIEDEYILTVKTNANHFHVKGSRRNFIESNIIEWYFDDHILMLDLSGAWTIDVETLTDLSKEYQLDFKIYAFERGMEFNIDFEVHKGEIIKCEEITFNDYDWECINPTMGG